MESNYFIPAYGLKKGSQFFFIGRVDDTADPKKDRDVLLGYKINKISDLADFHDGVPYSFFPGAQSNTERPIRGPQPGNEAIIGRAWFQTDKDQWMYAQAFRTTVGTSPGEIYEVFFFPPFTPCSTIDFSIDRNVT